MYTPDNSDENQLTVSAWVYIWALDSVSLIYVSVFMLLPYCCDYYNFVI